MSLHVFQVISAHLRRNKNIAFRISVSEAVCIARPTARSVVPLLPKTVRTLYCNRHSIIAFTRQSELCIATAIRLSRSQDSPNVVLQPPFDYRVHKTVRTLYCNRHSIIVFTRQSIPPQPT